MSQEKLQHAYSTTREECKTRTLQRAKVQHEMPQYIKTVEHEKSTTWKDYSTKMCNMEMVQSAKSATWKEYNMKTYKLSR